MSEITLEKFFSLAKEVTQKRELRDAMKPFPINVIRSAARGKMKETTHSMILADLLEHPQIQKRFLKRFLGITTEEKLMVRTELGDSVSRIDIALYNRDYFVIIENKANWAPEQPAQVYRYVEDIARKKYDYSKIYVLYLNPLSTALPSDISLKDIHLKLENRFKVVNMAKHVCDWLKDELDYINKESNSEFLLKSALYQYIDYIASLYVIPKNEKSEVMSKIQEKIREEMRLDQMSKVEKIETIDKNLKSISQIKDELIRMRESQMKEWLCNLVDDLATQYNAEKIDWFCGKSGNKEFENCNERWPKAGFKIKFNNSTVNVLIQYCLDSQKVEYGVRKMNKDESNPMLEQKLSQNYGLSTYGNQEWWYFVEPVTCREAKDRVNDLINILLTQIL